MRSDYYDGVSQAPLRPLPAGKKKKRNRRAITVFAVMLLLLAAGAAAFRLGMQTAGVPQSSPTPAEETAREETTIRRLLPPGEGSLTLAAETGESLDPTVIYERVSPAVVTIRAVDDYGYGGEGTGVIFDERGYFVTNSHVIEGTGSVTVTLADGREYPAYLIGMDAQTDLAVLHISASNLTAAVFGTDSVLKVGEAAYALGNPLGSRFSGSMTDGIISAINRNVTVGDYEMSLIQTTAALNQGNSGGALVDSRGRVIGITNMKMMSMSSTLEGLGFAIPSSTVAAVVNELMTHGHVTGRPMLGITVTPQRGETGGVAGLRVEEVYETSDAWAKGIREGDLLLEANGVKLTRNDHLLAQKEGLAAGESIRLRWRSGETGLEQEADILLMEQYELEG